MSIIIRAITDNDLEAIHALILEFATYQQSADKVSITVEQMKNDRHLFQCLVAETADNMIVGFVSYFYCYYSWTGRALYIDDLYVTQSYRRQGIGKSLLDSIVETARVNACIKVRWQVSNWNSNGISFYKNYGASIDDVEINCDYLLKYQVS